MGDKRFLYRLVSRLARDRPIDWPKEEQEAQAEEDRAALDDARIVAAVASFYRAVQAGDTSQDLAASVSLARSATGPIAPRTGSAALLAPGTRWGQLEILQHVGRGSFGDVYRARDTRLDRIVALKILARESSVPSEETVREARLLARVRHPHVVTVYGADRIEGRVGIWMEFLEGETLDQILRDRGSLDAREAALIGIDLCRALSAVHAAGIIHQDVKLTNVIRAAGGRIALMDFGLGRENRQDREARSVSGTPLFMAPEVLRGSRADPRSDVYSLGVVLFSLVTGTQPVTASSLRSLIAKHERGEMRRARDLRPDLPEGFVQVLDRSLARDPRQRFATPGEAEQALLQALGTAIQAQGAPTHASSLQRWAIVALGIALAVATVFGIRASRRANPGPQAPRSVPLAEVPSATLLGEAPGDLFGLAVAGVGDVDQDGFGDVLIGAPHHGAGDHGKVYLYRGNSTGLESHPSWTAEATQDTAEFGWSLATAKSIQDAFPRLVVGARSSRGIGRVCIYGVSKDGPSKQPVQVLSASRSESHFGFAIATGDVNHDGLDDLLVGEPYSLPPGETGRGCAHLYLSNGKEFAPEPAWRATGPPGSSFGVAVSMGGDINHDGYLDAVIGAVTESFGTELPRCGAAYVYLGSSTGLDSVPAVLPGRQAEGLFAREVHIAGDLDADGFADVLVGAEENSNGEEKEGTVEIYFGSKNGINPFGETFLEANTAKANFGGHASPLGDLDGDGCDDFFVGALRYQRTQPREGAAFVYLGSRNRKFSDVWVRVPGKGGSWYGAAGSSAGDVNGDGFLDFIVAAPSADTEAGTNVGQVDLFLNTRKR